MEIVDRIRCRLDEIGVYGWEMHKGPLSVAKGFCVENGLSVAEYFGGRV